MTYTQKIILFTLPIFSNTFKFYLFSFSNNKISVYSDTFYSEMPELRCSQRSLCSAVLNKRAMISLHQPPFLKSRLIEVVAADLGHFQIIVPTATKAVSPSGRSLPLAVPKREYDREGWIVYRNQVVSRLFELEIGEIVPEGCPFKPIKRLGPAVPIAFETHSRKPLPKPIADLATFSCQAPDTATPYCSVFRHLAPTFVRIYPIHNSHRQSLLDKAKQLLIEKAQFVAKNRDHLKQVPFYRENFNLADS